jgi:hypothetical protein
MKRFIPNRMFLTGNISGFGYCLFIFGASEKRALFYLGGILLMFIGALFLRRFKNSKISSPDQTSKPAKIAPNHLPPN